MGRRLIDRHVVALLFAIMVPCVAAYAGGPRYVAGTSYFDPSIAGLPVLWVNGQVSYFVDQGDLSSSVNHATAVATVAAAAAAWNAVPTAMVSITSGGTLAENVSGANVTATPDGITMPADIQSNALATPVGVVFDSDGAVIDAFFGVDASDPDDCIDSGAIPIVDNLSPAGTIVHALILVNGRCTGSQDQLLQIQFQLERAFGRVLGLDWSQANDAVLAGPGTPSYQQLEGWPVMRPVDINCNQLSVQCVPNPLQLRTDDIASVSRLYPVTAALPAKSITAASTISIHGFVRFRSGQGMQGVNVVARPIIPGLLLADDRYPAASVSGFLFTGDQGSAITGLQSQFGSTDTSVEGFYDITGIVLPPGETQADYEITLEPVDPLYAGTESVGPYALGSPTPSGTMPFITVRGLAAGQSIEQDFTIADSADDLHSGSGGTVSTPALLPASGEWQTRVASPGEVAWFAIPAQGGRHFTVETQALDEASAPTEEKMRSVLGVWNVLDPTTASPVNATVAPFNGAATGVSALAVDTVADGELRLGIADQRGDGRPDYVVHGRLLYVSSVRPSRLPIAGGPITITGSGFRPGLMVSLGSSISAAVTAITPTQIFAVAPASAALTGSLDLVIRDPATNGLAAIAAGISYGDATADTISIVTSPPAVITEGTGNAFTVRVFAPDQVTPIGGVPVFFSAIAGSVVFAGCSTPVCTVMTTGDGYATIQATATASGAVKLQAALANGNMLYAESTAIAPPALAPLTPPLFLAPDVAWTWAPQVEVWNGAVPAAKVQVNWSSPTPGPAFPASSFTDAQGIASVAITLDPLPGGSTFTLSACLAGTTSCVNIPAYVVHPATEILTPVSGTAQLLPPGATPAPVVLRVTAPGGQPVAGGSVALAGSIRALSPACSPVVPCAPGRLLSPIAATGISLADGSVAFTLTPIEGIPQQLTGLATAGSSSSVPFSIEISP